MYERVKQIVIGADVDSYEEDAWRKELMNNFLVLTILLDSLAGLIGFVQ